MPIHIRRATPADVPAAADICFRAFAGISGAHGFPPDFPSADVPAMLLGWIFGDPRFHAVVAEEDSRLVGSNAIDTRDAIAGIGPLTVDPACQSAGVGRALMTAVLDHAASIHAPGVRLVQAAFNSRSLSLYAKLGFVVREPLACLTAPASPDIPAPPGTQIRAATADDLPACNALCLQVHGHARGNELADAVAHGTASVALRHGRVVAYTSGIGYMGHAVAVTADDLAALIAAAPNISGPGLLLPMRQHALFARLLAAGYRVTQPLTLMSIGLYNEPTGAFLPSILY